MSTLLQLKIRATSSLPIPSTAEASGNVNESDILGPYACLNETSGVENPTEPGTEDDDLHLLAILQGLLLSVHCIVVNKWVVCKRLKALGLFELLILVKAVYPLSSFFFF